MSLQSVLEVENNNSITNMDSRDFKLFRELVHHHTGIWLRDGKEIMLSSRLARPIRRLGLSDFNDYYHFLCSCPKDSNDFIEFINCVTTNKTSFFRERHHFEFMKNKMVPDLQAAALRGAPKRVRIWCGASSTGEEPYTIAITLLEALPKNSWIIEVVASDIDTNVLSKAKQAIYTADCLEPADEHLLPKYFLRGKGNMANQVKVKPEVTRLVDFRRINLMDDYWDIDGMFDAIFFRNALIYFQQDVQDKFIRKMLRYLKPGGYLFLGNAEHVPWLHDLLKPLSNTMYQLIPRGK